VFRRLDAASDHILSFLDGRDVAVSGTSTTYKNLRDTFDVIVDCGYFSRPVCTADHDDDVDKPQTNGHDLHGTGMCYVAVVYFRDMLQYYEDLRCYRVQIHG